mmetsp:Transcript_1157/g.1894  ORF Transcript_1157/g.1894 Transcript_1157/m.1894 type:complete len:365 (-) Transcript_1157:79-1173(-)|eukprot:11639259-Ditylum_brightwellii.AAC.1
MSDEKFFALLDFLKRKLLSSNKLCELLDIGINNEDDAQNLERDAIIREVKHNPYSAEFMYAFSSGRCFPLHQAIKLGAPPDVVAALCSRAALNDTDNKPFEYAIRHKASVGVVMFLLQKQTEALGMIGDQEKADALRAACINQSPYEVVSLLVNIWPDVGEMNYYGRYTPLHIACHCKSSFDVVSLLVDTWPSALQKKEYNGWTPLHVACRNKSPLNVVTLLVNAWPDALQQKTKFGETPLHLACQHQAPLDVILLLLFTYPDAINEKNDLGETPYTMILGCGVDSNTLTRLNNLIPNETINFFFGIHWWNGVYSVFDKHPALIQTLDLPTYVMADFFSVLRRKCKLTTMWDAIRNKQDLLAGV